MPYFNNDLDALKKVMDYNAALADKLYANGTLNYTSGSKGRFQHVPVAVNKDMYYYDCKYDGYSSVILAYLDQFNGLMTPLAVGLGALTAFIGGLLGIIILYNIGALAVAKADGGQYLFQGAAEQVSSLKTRIKVLQWVAAITTLVGTTGTACTEVVSIMVSQDKADLMGYWKAFVNYHADINNKIIFFHYYFLSGG
jgi:hypothetical protein